MIAPAEYHYCMSHPPRGQPITNEEARAAVETELFAMKLTKPMTPAEKARGAGDSCDVDQVRIAHAG